jgi:hypothetical protein
LASLKLSYETGTVPQISVQLETANGFKRAIGEIDSGSARSLCPLHFLGDLGLSRSDLVKNEMRGSPAVGPEFDTYSANVAINGQIMIPSPEENDFKPWDKLFSMDLVFAKTDTLLLGQSDFFRCFDIRFLNGAEDEGTTLELVRCPPPARV